MSNSAAQLWTCLCSIFFLSPHHAVIAGTRVEGIDAHLALVLYQVPQASLTPGQEHLVGPLLNRVSVALPQPVSAPHKTRQHRLSKCDHHAASHNRCANVSRTSYASVQWSLSKSETRSTR